MATAKYKTIDEYIASFPDDVQAVMQELRRTIHEAAPGAGEKIAYQMAGFTLRGKNLIYFAGWQKHIGLYGIGAANDAFRDELTRYVGPKGNLSFPLDEPLQLDLIERIVRFKAQENEEAATKAQK